jgi:hypothetical protein
LDASYCLNGALDRRVLSQGYPVGTCGAEFGAFLRKKNDEYSRVIRAANIKAG